MHIYLSYTQNLKTQHMKTKIKNVLIFGLILILILGFTNSPINNLKKLIFSGIFNYEKLKEETPREYYVMTSALYDYGIRSKYAILHSILNINEIENETDLKIFVTGPHQNGEINYKSLSNFGHYNPEFLKLVYESIYELRNDKKFQTGKFIYDKYFKEMFRIYYESYNYLNNSNSEKIRNTDITMSELINLYQSKMESNEDSFYIWEHFRNYRYFMTNTLGYNPYESNTSVSFWVRRKIDGTDKEFFKILTLIIEIFDEDFFEKAIY